MIESLISLIIFIAVVAVIYWVVTWALGLFPALPAPVGMIVNLVFGLIVVVAALRFLATLI